MKRVLRCGDVGNSVKENSSVLHWLPVQRRVGFMITCLVHSLASLAPTYLTADIHLISEYGRHLFRSFTDKTLLVPQSHNRFGDRTFAVAGPVPDVEHLAKRQQRMTSYKQFRQYLKSYLFEI